MLQVLKPWFALGKKKHLQRKSLFPEMVGNHFFQGNAPQPPVSAFLKEIDIVSKISLSIMMVQRNILNLRYEGFLDAFYDDIRKVEMNELSRKKAHSID